MKKIFTLFALAAASLSMSAADFQLYFGDKPVEDGGQYETGYTIDYEDEWGVSYKQDAELFLHVIPGTSVTMTVTTDNPVQFCGITGQCAFMKAGETLTREGVINEAVYNTQLDLVTDLDNGQDPKDYLKVINLTVTAYATADPSTKVTVNVKLNNIPQSEVGGIGSAIADGSYIKAAAGNVLNYRVAQPTILALYSITGSQVARYSISNAGSIHLSSLPKGIYIYTDGKHKGKIIVK